MKNALLRICFACSCAILLLASPSYAAQATPNDFATSLKAQSRQLSSQARAFKARLLKLEITRERKSKPLVVLVETQNGSKTLQTLSLQIDHGRTVSHTYTGQERQALSNGGVQPLFLPKQNDGSHVLHARISAFSGHGHTRAWTIDRSFQGDETHTLLLTLNCPQPGQHGKPHMKLKSLP